MAAEHWLNEPRELKNIGLIVVFMMTWAVAGCSHSLYLPGASDAECPDGTEEMTEGNEDCDNKDSSDRAGCYTEFRCDGTATRVCGDESEPIFGHKCELVAGYGNVCGVSATGEIHCWGDGDDPDVCDVFECGESLPPAGGPYHGVSVGYNAGCALDADGRIICWGHPSVVEGLPAEEGFSAVVVGAYEACALDA